MKKKLAAMLILAMTAGLLAVGCGKEKEQETDVVDLTVPPVAVQEEEPEEEPEEEVQLDEKELRRLTEILRDSEVSNTEKNKMVRTIFKEIIKGGKDGKQLSFIYWKH